MIEKIDSAKSLAIWCEGLEFFSYSLVVEGNDSVTEQSGIVTKVWTCIIKEPG